MVRPKGSESAGSGPIHPAPVILPSSANIVARFEFETNRGNDGTKVLLVEWDCDPDEPPAVECQIDWEGKTEVLPVIDRDNRRRRRLVFWLPPTAAIPPTISISRPRRAILHAKPLPAIFAPGLGSDVPNSGHRGVLHTLWATMRMRVLEDEISREAKENAESVGLGMALEEKDFIIHHFGLPETNTTDDRKTKDSTTVKPVLLPLDTAASPPPTFLDSKSPMSLRMTEKLRGLKLATSPEGLAAAASDIAPYPKSVIRATIPGLVPIPGLAPIGSVGKPDDDDDGELFALPMSPRSPEMKRSPFSLL